MYLLRVDFKNVVATRDLEHQFFNKGKLKKVFSVF